MTQSYGLLLNNSANYSSLSELIFSTWTGYKATTSTPITLGDFAHRCRTDHTLADTPKGQLPCISPGGLFNGPRREENCIARTDLVLVDIDKKAQNKDIAKLNKLPWVYREVLRKDPHVWMVKYSPSGGLHVLMFAEDTAFARAYVEKLTGLIADPTAGPRVNSLCNYSYDPNLYLADQALVLKGILKPVQEQIAAPLGTPRPGDLERAERILKRQGRAYVDGQRNDYLMRLALLLRDCGHTVEEAIATMYTPYPDHRLEATVRSAYKSAKGPTRPRPTWEPEEITDRIGCAWASEAVPELAKRITPGRVLVIKARPGSGKTTMIPELGKALEAETLGVFPYHSQVFQRKAWEQLRGGTQADPTAGLIAATWDRCTEVQVRHRLVVLDECDNMITQNTPGFREEVIRNTWQHIRDAKYLVLMSATPEPMTRALELMQVPFEIVELDTPQRTKLTWTIHHSTEAELPGMCEGADLVFRDDKSKNAELVERMVLGGANRECIGIVDADTGEELFRYIGQHETYPDPILTVVATRRITSGVNIRKQGAVRVVVVDPPNLSDLVQAAGRFEGGRGADHIHLDVVLTRKPRQRKTYSWEALVNHLTDLLHPERSLFDLDTLDAMTAIQDSAVSVSQHLRRGGELAACYHAFADEVSEANIQAYLEATGYQFVEATHEQKTPAIEQIEHTRDELEQRRLAWIKLAQEDLPAAIGYKLAGKIKRDPGKYCAQAVEAAERTQSDDPGLPVTAKFLNALIRSGGLLDTYDEQTAFAILRETKNPEKVLKRHRRREAILRGLRSRDERGMSWRKAASSYNSALIVGEDYTREAIERLTEKHLGPIITQLDNTADWWSMARDYWNLVPTKDKRAYTVYHFLDLEEQVLNSKRITLKPLSLLKKRAQVRYKEDLRSPVELLT